MLTAMADKTKIQSTVLPASASSLALIVDGYVGEDLLAREVSFEGLGPFVTNNYFKTKTNRTYVSWHIHEDS